MLRVIRLSSKSKSRLTLLSSPSIHLISSKPHYTSTTTEFPFREVFFNSSSFFHSQYGINKFSCGGYSLNSTKIETFNRSKNGFFSSGYLVIPTNIVTSSGVRSFSSEPVCRESMNYDVVIVGAGPAGLSAAIRLKQLCKEKDVDLSVCVVEKGAEVGAHILSGNVFEPRALNELLPQWKQEEAPIHVPVSSDKFWLLSETRAFSLPCPFYNEGNYVISLSQLVRWLGLKAEELGVEIYPGFAASKILYDTSDKVIGIATNDMGVAKDGSRKDNFQPGVELKGHITLLAEGCRGSLSEKVIRKYNLQEKGHGQHQTYALGIKEVWEIGADNHDPGSVLHTIGWPLDHKTYGGSFLYHMKDRQAYPVRITNDRLPRTTAQAHNCKVTTTWFGFRRIWRRSNQVFDTVELSLPDYSYESQAVWIRVPQSVKTTVDTLSYSFRGGLHAAGHALLNIVPLYIICNPSDLASECVNPHDARYVPERILLYDPHPGGTGISAKVQPIFTELLTAALELLASCHCSGDTGCPNCVQNLACHEYNEVLHKDAAIMIIKGVLDAEQSNFKGTAEAS